MRVISKTPIEEFFDKHPAAKNPLLTWHTLARKCQADDLASLKMTFGSVDYVSPRYYVFNVGGNKFRIVAAIHFDRQTMFIRHVLTHEGYDEWTRINRRK